MATDEAPDQPELSTRQRIYSLIEQNPGCHMRELKKRADISSMGNMGYHLDYLQRRELVVTKPNGHYKRYYITRERVKGKHIVGLLRQEVPRRIAVFLLLHPGATHKEIGEQFTLSPSTLSFHLKKMVQRGLLTREKKGRTACYKVVDPDEVANVLITYRPTFLDKVVDHFAEVWG